MVLNLALVIISSSDTALRAKGVGSKPINHPNEMLNVKRQTPTSALQASVPYDRNPRTPFEIHPLLGPNAIYFDLSFFMFNKAHPYGSTGKRRIPSDILSNSATRPPTTKLVISSGLLDRRPICLDAKNLPTKGYIALGDVLNAIVETMKKEDNSRRVARVG